MSNFNNFSKKSTSITKANVAQSTSTPDSKPEQKPTGVPPTTDKPTQPK